MNLNIQQRQSLKEEARDLLLKGCYKMAMNKYLRLIKMGGEGFTQREWSVVHLNLAITLQFQNKLQEALERIEQAIKIDAKYEKPYYRKLQLLNEMEKYEDALHQNTIPYFIKNKEIDELLNKIRQEYQRTLGFEQLRKKLSSKEFRQSLSPQKLQKFIKQTHTLLFHRITENQSANEDNLSDQLQQHYAFLKKNQIGLPSFLHQILQLVIKKNKYLDGFWKEFLKDLERKVEIKGEKQAFLQDEMKLVGHLPLWKTDHKKFFKILNYILYALPVEEICKFLQINKHKIIKNQKESEKQQSKYLIDNMENVTDLFGDYLGDILQKYQIKEYLKKSLIMDILLSIFYSHEVGQFSQINSFAEAYKYKYKKTKSQFLITENEDKLFLTFIESNLKSFRYAYLLDSVVNYLKKDDLKNDLFTLLIELSSKNTKNTIIYLIIAMEINPTKPIFPSKQDKFPISQCLKHALDNKQYQELTIRFLLLLCLNDPDHLQQILECQNLLKETIKELIEQEGFISEIQSLNNSVRLIYLCIQNIEQKQQILFAQKMGVSLSQVHQARKLQGQVIDENIKQKIDFQRNELKKDMCEGWLNIIYKLIQKIIKYEERHLQRIMVKILLLLSEVNPYKFYHTQVVAFMLGCFSRNIKYESSEKSIEQNKQISSFFRIISKKCNPQIYKYAHLQSIADILLWGIKNAGHELQIFESLLSLINLSSQKIKIPLTDIVACLYEENQYIVHGSLELINNIIVNSEQEVQEKKIEETKGIVKKYYSYYRDLVLSKEVISQYPNVNDYAHPFKVYCTLLSVLMVLQVKQGVPELQYWKEAKSSLLKMKMKGQLGITVFKLAIHHEDQLPKHWYSGLEQGIEELKGIDYQKWVKLQRLIQ